MREPCAFHELPAVPGQPAGCAWGFYGPDDGKRDQLGSALVFSGRLEIVPNMPL